MELVTCRIGECPELATTQRGTRCGAHDWAWMCEFCYRKIMEGNLPSDWELCWQAPICPDCWERVQADGGINVVRMGSYAEGPDPRETPDLEVAGPWLCFVGGDATELRTVYDEDIITAPDGSMRREPKEDTPDARESTTG